MYPGVSCTGWRNQGQALCNEEHKDYDAPASRYVADFGLCNLTIDNVRSEHWFSGSHSGGAQGSADEVNIQASELNRIMKVGVNDGSFQRKLLYSKVLRSAARHSGWMSFCLLQLEIEIRPFPKEIGIIQWSQIAISPIIVVAINSKY